MTWQMTVLTLSIKDGTIKNIAEASDMLEHLNIVQRVKKYYLCYQRLHDKYKIFMQ